MQLRPYQKQAAMQAYELIKQGKTPYLAMEVRTGKTFTSFAVCYLAKAKSVLFVTKLMAIESIQKDYNMLPRYFDLTITNFESLHKVTGKYDIVIIDEAHSLGAFPKPSQRTKLLREIAKGSIVILLSGTPNPESYAQLYHQFWVAGEKSPFNQYLNFYKWAKDYVIKKDRIIHGVKIADYSKVITEKITPVLEELFITVSQKEAGFEQEVTEEIIRIPQDIRIKKLIEMFLKDSMYTFKDESVILGDTGAKKLNKVHQLCSGTVITEQHGTKKLIANKAEYIKKHYAGKKIAIYYIFKAEGDILREMFTNHTDSPEKFNESENLVFISQIQSGSMGVNLRTADYIIFYNIHYSSVQYWQARSRMQDKNRTKPCIVHWLFSEGGIEEKIYQVVLKKKDYTTYYFTRDYDRTTAPKKSNKVLAG